ncbi:uncharacterized protein CDAR_266641 [Caerostris darwini]|uniref:Uncharacterized protein n=1 Tax=Caerostris darwini TaxID=1538125 RepID=A0AAV4QN94_9ARAC|nr:uncharacterized protein CDAR_266641 [Caerostris darwini]
MKCDTHFTLWTALCVFLLCRADGTSLMKRIRERQSADDALRGLEMSSENWIQVPQPLQDVLMSIDDKLRGLDTFDYTLKLARLDLSLNQLVRRMESIESKLGRLDTKFDVRMEKVEEVVVSKDIKGEISNEHLSRRMENLNERINNKAAYLDAKLDIKLERIMNKLDFLERDLHNSVVDILERLVKSEERCMALENETVKKDEKLDEIRNQVNAIASFAKEDLMNAVNNNFEQLSMEMKDIQVTFHHKENQSEQVLTDVQTTFVGANERVLTLLQDSNNKIDNLSATFSQRERARSGADLFDTGRAVTQEQLENLTAIMDKALTVHEAKFKELDSDVEMYTRKVINGIQELWKTSDELKLDLSNTLEQGSKTREMVRQEFQRLHEQIEPLPKLEPKLSDISEDLDKKVFELSTTVDNSFATLLVAQNTFIDSCRRIQQEETHIYDILQQIVYEMRNRSISDIHRISTELRSQSSEINKSLAHVLTAVLLTGNITTSAVNDLLAQLKQKDQCVILKADNIEWNVMESFCRHLSQDEQFTAPLEHKNASEQSFSKEDIRKRFELDKSSPETETDGEAQYDSEVNDQNRDMNELHEYDMDYQLAEAFYQEKGINN